MFIHLQTSNNGKTILVNPNQITYVEDFGGRTISEDYKAIVHFSNTKKRVVNDKETVERKVEKTREEMMEGMMPDMPDMGGLM